MKLFYLLLITLVASFSAQAQAGNSKIVAKDSALTLTVVEVESSFSGGDNAWIRYLNNTLVYPPKAVRKRIEGTVVVQFIVAIDGSLSDVEAISGPEQLQQAAVNAVKQSPNWKPAILHGKKVRSYKKQPITFKLQQG